MAPRLYYTRYVHVAETPHFFFMLRRLYSTGAQAPRRQGPKFSGRGKFDPEAQSHDYVQEHDYTVTPETYLYLEKDNVEMFDRFPLVNNKILEKRVSKDRPQRVRMLARDFMDNSLYSSKYGYFSKAAEIYSPGIPFDFNAMKNVDEFLDVWASDFSKKVTGSKVNGVKDSGETKVEHIRSRNQAQEQPQSSSEPQSQSQSQSHSSIDMKPKMRQLWHTPTELFHPYYGQSLARYIVESSPDNEPIEIYEMGAGNGTLMVDIMDYIKANHPEIYKSMHYNVIEISPSLALRQKVSAKNHGPKVKIHNQSIFDWQNVVPDKCFFIALEVWDNFAHDVVRYDNSTDTPHQGYVVVDQLGDFVQIFSDKLDSSLKRALDLRSQTKFKPDPRLGAHPLSQNRWWRYLQNYVKPSQANLSIPEYVPTKYIEFLHILNEKFPQHHLLASDFTYFGDRIKGYNSPVTQTFVDGNPITVSTFMVLQGYFDIMFPTDFKLAQELYTLVTGNSCRVRSHQEFLGEFADKSKTDTKTGENPMIAFYRNAAFLTTKE